MCCGLHEMCVRSLSTWLRFLLPEYPRYLFPDIVFTTRKPIDSSLRLILPIPPSHAFQGRSSERTLSQVRRGAMACLFQDSLMEGCLLGDEMSSFVVGMELRDSDEVGRRLLSCGVEKREIGQRWTRIWRSLGHNESAWSSGCNEWDAPRWACWLKWSCLEAKCSSWFELGYIWRVGPSDVTGSTMNHAHGQVGNLM